MRDCFSCEGGWHNFIADDEGYNEDYKGGITGEMEICLTCNGTGEVEDGCYCHAYCSCECICGAWSNFECNCWE